ncbi:MAG: ATP-grasp domain-containing protein [Oscillospiraceae bacterium]|nr:ATP-grasp domain-containing protein [Oscillospiraceae bacterium]
MIVLFPSDYFNKHKADESFMEEYNAVLETGLFDMILYSDYIWDSEGRLELSYEPEYNSRCIYRGWMMKPEIYSSFYKKLADKKISLITSPEQYRHFHIFPEIYPEFGNDTAGMLIYPDGIVDLDEVKKTFSKFMVKDYVKSVKGTEFPKCFESSITKEDFEEQMKIFQKYRSGLYTGGICIKEYYDLKKYGERTNEYRVFYINGEIGTVSRNSLQGEYTPEPPQELIKKYTNLGSPLYTIDYAELSDGTWKIIEAGDGQVSGLSPNQDNNAFFRALHFGLSD